MSRLAWRFLAEGPLELESNFLLGLRPDSKYSSHKMCCYVKLMQADHGRGGILYIYPKKSCLGHYTVFSFYHITVKEPWVATSDAVIDLILDFEPVQFIAADTDSRDMWLGALRDLERVQRDHAVERGRERGGAGGGPSGKAPRVSAEELAGVDVAVHHGEHLHFSSPHKDERGRGWSGDAPIVPAARAGAGASETDDRPAELPAAAPADGCIVLNSRQKWDTAGHPPRAPLLVIGDLIHTIQSLYGVTKEGQRMEISEDNEEDEWHVVADSQMFSHFIVATCELQVVDLKDLEPHDRSKFFISAYSLLSMHAVGVLKLSLQEVLEEYTDKVAYVIENRVYTLGDIVERCS